MDRYILREMFVPFVIGTIAVVLMFQANLLIAQGKEIRLEGVPITAIFQLVLLRTPQYLSMTLPVGMALAASLAMSRLARESELTAMRSAGIPVWRIIVPVACVGLGVAALNFFIVDSVMPRSEFRANKLWQEMLIKAIAPSFRSNVMLTLQGRNVRIESVNRTQDGSLLLNGILIIESPRTDETWITTAKSGTYKEGHWVLKETYVRALKGESLMLAKPGADVVIDEPIKVEDIFRDPQPLEQSISTLSKAIKEAKKQQRETTGLEIAYHIKFSVPAACLVFALTGAVLAIWLARSGPFMGVLLSLFIVLLYYNIFVISTEVLGQNNLLGPIYAAWLPNVILLFFGMLALRRVE